MKEAFCATYNIIIVWIMPSLIAWHVFGVTDEGWLTFWSVLWIAMVMGLRDHNINIMIGE